MNNIIKRVWNQNRMVNIEDLRGMAFQSEDGGHTFVISGIDDDENIVPITGSVGGVFMRPDGTDVALTGTASGGSAYVTLSEDCYGVSGRFGFTVFVTKDGNKTAIYACIGTVAITSYGVVSSGTSADVTDLINALNAATSSLNTAIGSIPPDYSSFMASVAPQYSSAAVYSAGSYCWHDGTLYKAVVDITRSENWTPAHWTTAVLGNDLRNITLTENGTFLVRHSAQWSGTVAYGNTTATGTDIETVMQDAVLLTQIDDPSGDGVCTLVETARDEEQTTVVFRSIAPLNGGKYVRASMDYGGPYPQIMFALVDDPTPTSASESNGRVTFSDAAGAAVFYFDLPLFDGSVTA